MSSTTCVSAILPVLSTLTVYSITSPAVSTLVHPHPSPSLLRLGSGRSSHPRLPYLPCSHPSPPSPHYQWRARIHVRLRHRVVPVYVHVSVTSSLPSVSVSPIHTSIHPLPAACRPPHVRQCDVARVVHRDRVLDTSSAVSTLVTSASFFTSRLGSGQWSHHNADFGPSGPCRPSPHSPGRARIQVRLRHRVGRVGPRLGRIQFAVRIRITDTYVNHPPPAACRRTARASVPYCPCCPPSPCT